MPVLRMHEDEVEVDDALVRRLVATQLPDHAGLPVERIDAWGTDHAIFRLGRSLSVRVPKIGWAAGQGERERRWLPVLAPHLPVAVPIPVAVGEPALGYPYPWYVSPWLDGRNPQPGADVTGLAGDLAGFVRALQRVDAVGGPAPRPGKRGGPLAAADGATRRSADQLRGDVGVDVDGLLAAWDAGLHAPPWGRAPVWVHGDLSDGNLLVDPGGRLTGVIDWGGLTTGDPAVELMVAWNLFDQRARAAYRDSLGFVDAATWLRGRAWAVSAALMALPYYRDTNPDIVARSWRVVRAVLADER